MRAGVVALAIMGLAGGPAAAQGVRAVAVLEVRLAIVSSSTPKVVADSVLGSGVRATGSLAADVMLEGQTPFVVNASVPAGGASEWRAESRKGGVVRVPVRKLERPQGQDGEGALTIAIATM